MNYNGNMPDWHQYNASQTNEVTSSTQNVNSGHLAFIPGVSHPPVSAINLGSEGYTKHQNETNFNPRNFQSYNNVSNGPNISNNGPLASMVQMQNCIGHYGSTNTRNPMLDNINASVDPRNVTIGSMNDEIGYRSNQVPFNGPITHLSGPNCSLNASTGSIPGPGPGSGLGPRTNAGQGSNSGTNSGNGTGPGSMFGPGSRHGPVPAPRSGSGPATANMGPRNTNIGSVPSSKPGPSSFMPCKGLCCNSDPNINYQQWEKFGPYQNNTSFRDNVHPPGYQMENRHFGNNCNYRKDNLDGKEVMGPVLPNTSAIDHTRSFNDYKYKDHLIHRNYSASSGLFHNYPIQNYNYSAEHQKYTYPMKEYPKTNNMNISNSGMMKHQEQNFITQQKFNNKQFQYQNGGMLSKGVLALNVNTNMATSPQNPYFNPQFPRNIPTEMNHECQETTDNAAIVNRMSNTFMHSSTQHQVYQHKIAMQKFSMENHLNELSRIPGYQSHPKYKEYVLRYRELLKLQQSTSYQNPVQQTSRITTPVSTAVPPINLQFDQNGMLINSSYIQEGFPKVHHPSTIEQPQENIEKQTKDQTMSIASNKCQQPQQPEQLIIPSQTERVPSSCAETFQKRNQFSIHKDFNQNQLKVQTSENHSFDTLNAERNNDTMLQQKVSKEFANKPELDVRQFLANWDETDDEDGAASNLQNAALNETTPVVVVSYEDVDLSKTPQETEVSRRSSYCSNETGLDHVEEGETNVMASQDCLTISYSPFENTDIAKTSKRTIGEGVMKPGSIIHCISNGPDEIPTIHIVDNLEIGNILGASNEQMIQTLEKQKSTSFFRETENNETETMDLDDSEQPDKNENSVLSNYDGSLNDVTKTTSIEDPGSVETTAVSNQVSTKSNLDVVDNMDLKKQSSFVNEESHNPDDISLPDLPTSECTPISTTLNTPIHSDIEESSQNMEDLSMSTNPIEVMQNSPVISFTQLNSEEKSKSRTLSTLELEFHKENRFKANEQEMTLGNFDFSTGNSKSKSTDTKGKQAKSLVANVVRKKVFLTDGKETDTGVLDTCATLTSMEYELEEQQDAMEVVSSLECKSPTCSNEEKHRNAKGNDSNVGFSPTTSDDEVQTFKRRKIKTSSVSSIANLPEIDLSVKKATKKTTVLEDRYVDKYLEKSLVHRKDANCSKRSKSSETRRFDNSNAVQSEEHSLCHTTSHYKHHSVAVIKDNVALSDKRMTDRTTSNNTKELSEEVETKKHGKLVPGSHENLQFQSSKKSELLQKDLKSVDGDVRYTAEEIRMLKEYRRKKKQHSLKTTEEESQKEDSARKKEHSQTRQSNELSTSKMCLTQNVLSAVNLGSEKKSFIKNADFGIQVANVNLKIKDSEIDKEVILGDKDQEQKDCSEGSNKIKIEINVSCTEQNSKGQEQNKRQLYDDRGLYEIEDTACSSRLHAKESETDVPIGKAHRIAEASVTDTVESRVTSTCIIDANSITVSKKSRRTSNEDTCSRETADGQKSLCNNTLCKNAIEGTYPLDDKEAKSKCAIPNTAIVDANNKIKVKNRFERNREKDSRTLEATRVQTSASTSLVDTSMETFKRHEEKEVASQSRSSKKVLENSPDVGSLSPLNALDFPSDRLDYRKYSGINFDPGHVESGDDYPSKWKKPKIDQIFEDCDMFQSSSGYVNPIFSSIDKLEDLHTVPVYTTKDGKISYSPNRRFTYHELMMETRRRDVCGSGRKPHYVDTWNSYSSSKFRRLYKKKRRNSFSEKRKHEFKDTKYLYERKKNCSDEFYGRSHSRYKDFVHSIKNNNAIWSDHYKLNRMYSSSDTEEEIVSCNKGKIAWISNCKKAKSPKNHATLDELGLESKNKEDPICDISMSKDKDTIVEEPQSVQSKSLDDSKNHENCQNNDNSNNELDIQIEASSIATIDHANEEVKSNEDECSTTNNIFSEQFELNESTDLNSECTEPNANKSENSIIAEEKNVNNTDGTNSELLNKEIPLSDESKENISTTIEEKRENETCSVETTNHDEEREQNGEISLLDIEKDIEDTENVKICKDLEVTQTEILESNSPAKDILETCVDSENTNEQVSQEPLEPEKCINVPDEIVEESLENIESKETESLMVSKENTLENKKDVQLVEKIKISIKEQDDERVNEETKKNNKPLVEESDNSFTKEAEKNNSEVPDKLESQLVQIEAITNEQNNSEDAFTGVVNNEQNKITPEQMDNEAITSTDLPESIIQSENENTIKSSVEPSKEEMEIALPNVKENLTEEEVTNGHLKNENHIDKLENVSEHISNQSSSVEEMSVLSMYCTVKNSPIENVENDVDKNREDEEKELQNPYESSRHSLESNTDVKAIPKLIIKKADALNPKPESSEYNNSADIYGAKLLPETRPKIPKMIIMKSRSRSATPTIEVLDKSKSSEHNDTSMDVDNSDSEQYTLKYNNCESKVPKVKIKLEDISSKDLKLYLKRKALKKSVPKVKIKKLKIQDTKAHASSKFEEDSSGTDASDFDEEKAQELVSSDAEAEKLPKLKLKRQEEEKSPDRIRKDCNVSKLTPKKSKKIKEEDVKHSSKQDTALNDEELKKKYPQYIVEKIPKVIIKRTQIGTEFKCEISKDKKASVAETQKWQPKVKLQRLQLLDNIVKDLKQSKIMLKDIFNTSPQLTDEIDDVSKAKLSRSNSASSLSPAKCKQRRLSDSGYTKVDTKSAAELSSSSKDNRVADLNSANDEYRNLKKKNRKRLSPQNKGVDLNDEDETEEMKSEDTTRSPFKGFLMNEDNDLMITKSEYSCFMSKESTPIIEDKFLESANSFDDNVNSIIKIESSDESQTTIEILPASPHSYDDEIDKNCEFESMDTAIPTQLELELELIDNNMQHSGTFVDTDDQTSHFGSKCTNEKPTMAYFGDLQHSSQNSSSQDDCTFKKNDESSENTSNSSFYCNDPLVKKVLAAKEALKKCLTRSENVEGRKSRPKTVAEKKQGLSFNFKDLEESCCKYGVDFSDNTKVQRKSESLEKKEHKLPRRVDEDVEECPTASTYGCTSISESTTISLKASKRFDQHINDTFADTEADDVLESNDKHNAEKLEEKCCKKKTNNRSQKDDSTKTKEDNMPLLVPEFALNFDSSSDRDSSRSPPVITNQEEVDNITESEKSLENKVIISPEKIEESKIHPYKDCEMTIADIITQLAYHEKATIKHRRYCNLCERWFPTTSRHRRHLAGYQHRYMELTQRKSIHALFILFTGKPCPRLLPANVIRNDCSIGELTPLQIAVQDVAKCVEYTQPNFKTKE